MKEAILIIKGAISELPEEDQSRVKEAYNQLKSVVDQAETASPGGGIIALALLATERVGW